MESGEVVYGEACVVQPETQSSAVGQYTTYLVKVRLGEDQYSSRKRYSDFEWVRKAIATNFPGIRVPPLPKKQGAAQGVLAKAGISKDASFIEARRAGLEDFLQSILHKRELCMESQILKRFLAATTDQEFEDLKKKIDSVSVTAKYTKYSQVFAEFKEASVPGDDRIISTKIILAGQSKQLYEVVESLKEVVEAQQAVTKAFVGAEAKFSSLSQIESGTFSTPARLELAAGLRQQRDAMQAFPVMHYDLLLKSTERELSEAEAMQEALDSLDNLQKDLQEARPKLESMGITLKNVLAGGEIPSTGTGVARMLGMAAPKDREARIAEMKAEHEQKHKDVASLEEFIKLARIVLVHREIDRFFEEKKVGHRHVKNTFADLSRTSADRFKNVWSGTGTSMSFVAHSYPAIDEPDVEYD